jgi:hypothetical protein
MRFVCLTQRELWQENKRSHISEKSLLSQDVNLCQSGFRQCGHPIALLWCYCSVGRTTSQRAAGVRDNVRTAADRHDWAPAH